MGIFGGSGLDGLRSRSIRVFDFGVRLCSSRRLLLGQPDDESAVVCEYGGFRDAVSSAGDADGNDKYGDYRIEFGGFHGQGADSESSHVYGLSGREIHWCRCGDKLSEEKEMKKLGLVLVLACAGVAQAQESAGAANCSASGTPCLRVTASLLSTRDTKTLFGPLAKQYAAAAVDVCYKGEDTRSVPLAVVRQQLKLTNGIVILPNVAALTVIAKAQAGTKVATIERYGLGLVEAAALATAWPRISLTLKNTLESVSLSGAQALGIFQQVSQPVAMIAYSAVALPETLNFSSAQSCTPQAIQLVERISAGGGNIDFTMPLPVVAKPGASPGNSYTIVPGTSGQYLIVPPLTSLTPVTANTVTSQTVK